jgi:hypothetical protein
MADRQERLARAREPLGRSACEGPEPAAYLRAKRPRGDRHAVGEISCRAMVSAGPRPLPGHCLSDPGMGAGTRAREHGRCRQSDRSHARGQLASPGLRPAISRRSITPRSHGLTGHGPTAFLRAAGDLAPGYCMRRDNAGPQRRVAPPRGHRDSPSRRAAHPRALEPDAGDEA